jgi:hypothetical protein
MSLFAAVELTNGLVGPRAKIMVIDETGAVIATGTVPDGGRTKLKDHRIHRGISNMGFSLPGGSIVTAFERITEDVIVYRVEKAHVEPEGEAGR